MEFIEERLFNVKKEQFPFLDIHHLTSDDPILTPITDQWQKDKCALLDIQFHQRTDQHSTIAGHSLRLFEPWTLDTIEGDGNCLFRCLSKVISGSEQYHSKLRGEICRYMLSDGKDVISWYFKQVLSTTPSEYLSEKCMYNEENWGSDVELMAASAMLKTDIYVANKIYLTNESIIPEVRWSRIRSSNDNSKDNAIYIANFFDHYQPVNRMINSLTPTFYCSGKPNIITIDEPPKTPNNPPCERREVPSAADEVSGDRTQEGEGSVPSVH